MSGHQIDPSLYRDRDAVPVRRALISVSDKTGLLDLADEQQVRAGLRAEDGRRRVLDRHRVAEPRGRGLRLCRRGLDGLE